MVVVLDCVIVGAGLAGLTAAADLAGRGKDVVVLEARDRVGGRIDTTDCDGLAVETGAQWITAGNETMREFIEAAGLQLVAPEGGALLIRAQGGVFRSEPAPDRVQALTPFEIADLGQGVLRFSRLAERVESDPTWAAANVAWLGQPLTRWVKTNLRTPAAQRDFAAVLASMTESVDAEVSLGDALAVSVKGTDLEGLFTVSGGLTLFRVAGGMHQVAEFIAAGLGEAVKLNQVVSGIDHGTDSVSVHTESGQSYQARRVLVTLPPWLALRLDYSPPLPAWRHEVGGRTTAGHVIKACVIYPRPWWRERGLSGQMSADQGAIRVTFDVSDAQGPGVLVGFFEGVEAAAMSKHTAAIREGAFIDSLASVFGEEARQPHLYVEYDWAADKFTRGCHTPHFAPGIWRVNGQMLAEPAGPIHFAGAEYAGRGNGYLEGAARSGREEARTILRSL